MTLSKLYVARTTQLVIQRVICYTYRQIVVENLFMLRTSMLILLCGSTMTKFVTMSNLAML